MLKFCPAMVGLSLLVTGCVAGEDPALPRAVAPVAARPIPSTATFEDAPVPNRRVGRSTEDSVIRLAH